MSFDQNTPPGWERPLDVLRRKWGTIPSGNDSRQRSAQLATLSDDALLAHWERARANDCDGPGFGIRGWYHEAYRSYMPGKKVLDIGCGMGISTIAFAEMGARLTFVDIVEDNVRLCERICALKGIEASFLYLRDMEDLSTLAGDYDTVTAIGSLINTPASVTKLEVGLLVEHLKPGGRWLHFGYPKTRWVREGALPFSKWGEMTDGPGTPWMEFHDRERIEWFFEPHETRIVFECEWHNADFNWFDIELVRHGRAR